jgi:hypothetical protein
VIITSFGSGLHAITAGCGAGRRIGTGTNPAGFDGASIGATVAGGGVLIITSFGSGFHAITAGCLAGGRIGTGTSPAGFGGAGVGATVTGSQVSVITGFSIIHNTIPTRISANTGSFRAVPTWFGLTSIGTAIARYVVAVITGFAGFDLAVAANRLSAN